MPRSPRIDRPTRFEVNIPESVRVAVEAELWSDVEGKVPYGKFGALVVQLLRDWLGSRAISQPTFRIVKAPWFSTLLWLVVKPDEALCEVFLTESEALAWVNSNS